MEKTEEDRKGWCRLGEHGSLVVVLDNGNASAPNTEAIADGRWHPPGVYSDPSERREKLRRVRARVEINDKAEYRVAQVFAADCLRCGEKQGIREWRSGEPRHVWSMGSVTRSTPDGPLGIGASFCMKCSAEVGGGAGCNQFLEEQLKLGLPL